MDVSENMLPDVSENEMSDVSANETVSPAEVPVYEITVSVTGNDVINYAPYFDNVNKHLNMIYLLVLGLFISVVLGRAARRVGKYLIGGENHE